MLKIVAAVAVLLVSGCASDPKWLENRVACTADGKELHAISKWGPLEIGSEISSDDAKAVCGRMGNNPAN